jgi:hypothetical protein
MKNRKIHLIFGILLILTFLSCDCWILVDGKIINSKTNRPIENAKIEFLNIKSTNNMKTTDSAYVKNVFFTDSIGEFQMQSDNFGRCPKKDIRIRIFKESYGKIDMILEKGKPTTGLIIKLKKE